MKLGKVRNVVVALGMLLGGGMYAFGQGQIPAPPMVYVDAAPTGTCSLPQPYEIVKKSGIRYSCAPAANGSGAWQLDTQSLNVVTSDPTGNACTGLPLVYLSTTGAVYTCKSGAMALLAPVPVFTWSDTFLTCCNAVSGGHKFTPPSATVTRLEVNGSTLLSGCTSSPVFEVKDGTSGTQLAAVTMTTGTAYWDSGPVSATIPAGHPLQLQMITAGVSCNAVTLYATVQYSN